MNKPVSLLRFTYVFAVAAVLLISLIASNAVGAPARSLTGTDDPQEAITAFFDSLHSGDYDAANQFLGHCSLVNTDIDREDDVTRKLFNALSDSISFSFVGDCRVDGLDAAQTVRVTYFDIDSSAQQLNALTKQLLDTMINEMDNASELYDENGEYRQDVVMEIFDQAAVIMLESASDYYVTKEFDITLFYDGSSWYIEPSDSILDCMTGGMN